MIQIGPSFHKPYQRIRVAFWLTQGEYNQEFATSREDTRELHLGIETLIDKAIQELEIVLARWLSTETLYDLEQGRIPLDESWEISATHPDPIWEEFLE